MECFQQELDNRTKFVDELYYHDNSNDKENIISNFYREFFKTSFYAPVDKPLEKFIAGDSTITYKVDRGMDQLLYVYYRLVLPALCVKDEYKDKVKIAWTHHLLHNIFNQMKLVLNTSTYQTLDKYILDIHFSHNIPNDLKSIYKEQIGSIPLLENWSHLLPSYILGFEPPFFFCSDISQSIPLDVFKDTIQDANFHSSPKLKIYELLRISVRDETGNWNELKDIDLAQLKHFVDGFNEDAKLPIPDMIGRYAKLNSEEKEWKSDCSPSAKQVYYIDNYIDVSPANSSDLGSASETFLSSTSPCKKIFWIAENVDSLQKNLHSNYTTNESDIQKGWNPCYSCKLKYGQKTRFDITYDQSSRHFPKKHCLGTPDEKGYNVYTYSHDRNTFDSDIGATFNESSIKLTIQLKDTDPFKIPVQRTSLTNLQNVIQHSKDSSPSSSKYNVKVYLLSYRRVKFEKKYEKNDVGKMVMSIEDY